MALSEDGGKFAGKLVKEFRPGGALDDPQNTAWRIAVTWDDQESIPQLFAALLEQPRADQLTALVIGPWFTDDPYEQNASVVVEALVAAAPQLASLRAIFLGDIESEECEISWIQQTDVSPLWSAFPRLEEITLRGAEGLRLGRLEHDYLRRLTIECGGLSREVLAELAAARLPALEHLEIYLGDSNYGWDGTMEDVRPLLSSERFPKLRYLGLRNAEISDEIAKEVVQSPLLEQLETLDLSLGALTDEGGRALLECEAARRLKRLDLSHHYMTPDVVTKLEASPLKVDCSDAQKPDRYRGEEYRYVAIGE